MVGAAGSGGMAPAAWKGTRGGRTTGEGGGISDDDNDDGGGGDGRTIGSNDVADAAVEDVCNDSSFPREIFAIELATSSSALIIGAIGADTASCAFGLGDPLACFSIRCGSATCGLPLGVPLVPRRADIGDSASGLPRFRKVIRDACCGVDVLDVFP